MEQWQLGKIFRAIVDACLEMSIDIVDAMWLAQHATSALEKMKIAQ